MIDLRLPEVPPRYNTAETFLDSHRGVREDRVAIRCQRKSAADELRERDVATGS